MLLQALDLIKYNYMKEIKLTIFILLFFMVIVGLNSKIFKIISN